jgi:hypothetical protein
MVAPYNIQFGQGITVGAGNSIGVIADGSGIDGCLGYAQVPGPIVPGVQIEDTQDATVNNPVGFTLGVATTGTGVAIGNLSASNVAFFSTYGTGIRTVTWGAGSTYATTAVNLTYNDMTSGYLIFSILGISYPATFNWPVTFT